MGMEKGRKGKGEGREGEGRWNGHYLEGKGDSHSIAESLSLCHYTIFSSGKEILESSADRLSGGGRTIGGEGGGRREEGRGRGGEEGGRSLP